MSVIGSNILAGASGGAGGAEYTIERSLRFNSSDSAHLDKNFASAGNRRTFTFSCWVKRSALTASGEYIFTSSNSTGNNYSTLNFNSSDDKLVFQGNNGSGSLQFNLHTDAVFRDSSAWYSIVLSVDSTQATSSNRVKIYVNGQLQTFSTATYPPQNFEFRINDAQEHRIGSNESQSSYLDAYLADVHFIDGQALAPTDFGEYDSNKVWQPITPVISSLNNGTTWSNNTTGSFDSSYPKTNGFDGNLSTVTYADSSNSAAVQFSGITITQTNRLRVYGASGWSNPHSITSNGNTTTWTNQTSQWHDLTDTFTTPWSFDSYNLTHNGSVSAIEIGGEILIDSYNNSTGYGTNGFYLNFSDNSNNTATTLGKDSSGNGNNWTPNNLSVTAGTGNDSLEDTPTNNWCTFNPLMVAGGTGSTLSNGNLDVTTGSIHQWRTGTIGISSGKWYVEYTATTNGNTHGIGIRANTTTTTPMYSETTAFYWQFYDLNYYDGGSASSYGSRPSAGAIVATAIDLDNGTIEFFVNNVSQGQKTGVTLGDTYQIIWTASGQSGSFNFGQRPFDYTPPTGFKALNTANLPEPTIADGSKYFDIALDTGANILSSTKALCDGNANFLWIKDRANNSTNHHLIDIVRDPQLDGTPYLISNGTDTEATLGTYSAPSGNSVGWAWDAGSSNTSISAGGLNSSVYDQSQTWSTNATLGSGNIYSDGGGVDHVPSRIFDGNSNTSCLPEKGTASSEVSLDLTSTITGVTNIRVQTSSVDNFKINGGSNIASTGNGYQTIYDGAAITLTSLKFIRTSGVSGGGSSTGFSVTSVEINGKQLIDSGVTPSINVPSIASTVRANSLSGVSLALYTGSGATGTVSHGLNKKPEVILLKGRNANEKWKVMHVDANDGSDNYYQNVLHLDTDQDFTGTGNTYPWGGVEPTSLTFGVGNISADANRSGSTSSTNYFAICMTSVEGFSKFGSYTGGGTTHPFVYLGFAPKFLMVKGLADSRSWRIWDSERNSNPNNTTLHADITQTETYYGADDIDLLSNGFKMRSGGSFHNSVNITYLYLAFAEHPFKTARAR